MLSTGDVQGCLRKLEGLLRAIKYPGQVDYDRLSKGDPSAFLPIVSFTLTSFSAPFTKQLSSAGLELTGKTDLRFTDTLYKVLRDIFHYKPILTKQQFLQWGFSQRKISVICDIINLVLQKHHQLKKSRVKCPASQKDDREVHPEPADIDTVLKRPYVVNHVENPSTFPPNSCEAQFFSTDRACTFRKDETCSDFPQNEVTELAAEEQDKGNIHCVLKRPYVVNHVENPSTFPPNSCEAQFFSTDRACTFHEDETCTDFPQNEVTEMAAEEQDKGNIHCSSAVEREFSTMEGQLEGIACGLHRLSVLEERLEELERQKDAQKIVKNEGQVITISRDSWENLMSRILLLETKLELTSTKMTPQLPCQPSIPSSSSTISVSHASKDDLKEPLKRISDMLKSTSSLLKNPEEP
ncbi:centrosomal protein of 44 kDa [Pholidichthys leucotaenia]